MRKILALASFIFLAGCAATIPEELQVAENYQSPGYSDVMANVESASGKKVRWGGVIASVENKESETTVEVVYFDLKANARPKKTDKTAGRFKVKIAKFLDPVVYSEGRQVTFVGTINGVETGKVGEYDYQFPVVSAENSYLWKELKEIDVTVYDFGMGFYPWNHPYYWHYPHQRRVTVIRNNATSSRVNPPVKMAPPSNNKVIK